MTTLQDKLDALIARENEEYIDELEDFFQQLVTDYDGVADRFVATSTSSVTVSAGSKSFTLSATGKSFAVGSYVVAFKTSDPSVYMIGRVTAFSDPALTISVSAPNFAGSGSVSGWTIALSAAPANLSSATVLATGATTAQTIGNFMGRVVYAEHYGVTADGTTDDADALIAAIAAAQGSVVLDSQGSPAGGGVALLVPPGNIVTTKTIPILGCGVSLLPAGRDATVFRPANGTGHVFQIGDSSSITRHITLAGFSVRPSVSKTSGSLIAVDGAQRVNIQDVDLFDGYDGVSVENHGNQAILNIIATNVFNPGRDGLVIGGTGVANGIHITNTKVSSAGRYGIGLFNCSGVTLEAVENYEAASHGVAFVPGSSQFVQGVMMSKVIGDSSGGSGYYFGGSGKIAEIRSEAGYVSSNAEHGIHFDASSTATIDDVVLANTNNTNNQKHGVLLGRGTRVGIFFGSANQNSRASSGTYDGIRVAAGVSDFTINGVWAGAGGWIGLNSVTNRQGYGVKVESGSSDRYTITGNHLSGNVTGALDDQGTGTNKTVHNPGLSSLFGNALRVSAQAELGGTLTSKPGLIVPGNSGVTDWVEIAGQSGGNPVTIKGLSDANSNVSINVVPKGSGAFYVSPDSATGFAVAGSPGATRYVVVAGSTGDPILSTSAGRLSLDTVLALKSYTVATKPLPTERGLIHISDEAGGPQPAQADGSNWRRWTDNAIVS